MSPVAPVLARLDQDFEGAVERLRTLLRIPSISTDPAHSGDTRRAAEWLAGELAGMGFRAGLRETPGHPMVVAHHPGPGPQAGPVPHILYYGHYDVQPAEPLELWDSPPFDPAIVEGPHGRRVVARGAVDDKGQVMTFVEAFRAWHAVHAGLPVRVTVLLEGEEESGSTSLLPFLRANREELAADVCIVTDTNSWDIDTPAVTTSLRGMVYLEITVHGPDHDLHSGLYGGAVPNPINVLTRMLGDIHDERGRVRFPGFYDGVSEPTAGQRATWAALGLDERGFMGGVGLEASVGEAGYGVLERLWARPTCDVNGIWGGYTGPGSKTVIPASASAKLSCRLVPGQDPARIAASVRHFLEERLAPGCRLEIAPPMAQAPGIRVSDDSPWLAAAEAGLEEIYRRPPVRVGVGGSIPVVGWIHEALGIDSVLVGFGLDDDRIHSPNEKFELRCLHNGMRSHAAILARLADAKA